MENIIGEYATLKTPYRGYSRILIIRRCGVKWLVEICGSGKEIELYSDEFDID